MLPIKWKVWTLFNITNICIDSDSEKELMIIKGSLVLQWQKQNIDQDLILAHYFLSPTREEEYNKDNYV